MELKYETSDGYKPRLRFSNYWASASGLIRARPIQRLSEECECVSRELLAFDVCRGVMDKLSGDFIEVTRRVSTPQKRRQWITLK
jgi:hypothetical protein